MSTSTSTKTGRTPEELREAMVATLVEKKAVADPEIIRALRTVPRHLVEGPDGPVDVELVYDPFQVALKKKDAGGVSVSTVSAAHVQAIQLEQAQVCPGQRVLEIGSSGPNAAYLAELVGEAGLVVTIDIDSEVTDRATKFLADAGYPQVHVLTGDAGYGAPQFAPFDLIMVTVETTDVPEAWWQQLAEDGRIVAPMRWRGQRRTVALQRQGSGVLVAEDIRQAGFVPMQGLGEQREVPVLLHDVEGQRVGLRLDDGMEVDVPALGQALLAGQTIRWTGVLLQQQQRYAPLDMWLATNLEIAVMTGDVGAHEAGLIPKPNPIGWPVLIEGPSMAYRTLRPTGDESVWEIGVIGHGPDAAAVAGRYAEAVQAWDPDRRPRLTVTRREPNDIPGTPQRSVQRRTSTLTISWP